MTLDSLAFKMPPLELSRTLAHKSAFINQKGKTCALNKNLKLYSMKLFFQ